MNRRIYGTFTENLYLEKAIYAMVPVIANFFVSMFGFDPTNIAILVLDAAFGILVVAQAVIDSVHGSPSDGTDAAVAKTARAKAAS